MPVPTDVRHAARAAVARRALGSLAFTLLLIEFLDELPRNATGKVLKRALREREAQRS